MNPRTTIIISLAYITGLLSTAIASGHYLVLGLGIILAFLMPAPVIIMPVAPIQKKSSQAKKENSALGSRKIKSHNLSVTELEYSFDPRQMKGELKPVRPKRRFQWIWVGAGIIGFLASLYFQARIPRPAVNDISSLLQKNIGTLEQVITVQGEVITSPRLTRSGRSQFWLRAAQTSEIIGSGDAADLYKEVTGKLYVTAPLLQTTGVYPGQWVGITGTIYKPKPATNPGGFDFQAYLTRQGAFAGFKAKQINFLSSNEDGSGRIWQQLWKIRRRILRSQVEWLGIPAGPLLSAMVLGRQGVDLAYSVNDAFVQVGLAHALAASGFHVALLLGIVLGATRHFTPQKRLIYGTITLLIFLALTGISPSVLRAVVMGLAGLIGLVNSRQVAPVATLLFSAFILLIINPLWIWDVGFQLSFLATLGLLVSVNPIVKKLDWLPVTIASAVAVPLAAMIWTLPLQIYIFKVISPYSIFVNMITAPLISLITLGGFLSAMGAMIAPLLGSAIAWLLAYPLQILIGIVNYFAYLPGNSFAVGAISLWQLIGLYGLILLTWWQTSKMPVKQQKKYSSPKFLRSIFTIPTLALLGAIAITIVPVWYHQISLFQTTVLATAEEPVLLIQDEGKIILINCGDENTARFTVLPFLRQQGINHIDWAIATHSQSGLSPGWSQIVQSLPIKTFYDVLAEQKTYYVNDQSILNELKSKSNYQALPVNQIIDIANSKLQLINAQVPVVVFKIREQVWLLLGETNQAEQAKLLTSGKIWRTQVLWWSGNRLNKELLNVVKPDVAIASSNQVEASMMELAQKNNIQLFWTGRDGAIQWSPSGNWETTLESDKIDSSLP
jgi:competence protein ComEC